MTSTQAYFVSDHYFAEFYAYEIKKKHKDIIINTFNNFEEYFYKIIQAYSEAPFLLVKFYYYDYGELLNWNKKRRNPTVINFLSERGIDKLRMNVAPVATPNENHWDYNDAAPIIQRFVNGNELRFNPRLIFRHLLESAYSLHQLRMFHVDGYDINLDDFLEQFAKRLSKLFKIDYGIIELWEKGHNRHLFKRTLPEISMIDYPISLEQRAGSSIKVREIDKEEKEGLENVLKSHKTKYRISIPIQAKHAYGHLDFFSRLDRISWTQNEMTEFTQKMIVLFLDNVYFFQEMSVREGIGIELFDNSDDGILVIDKNRVLVDMNETISRQFGWGLSETLGRPCKDLFGTCDKFGAPLCNDSTCPLLNAFRGRDCVIKDRVFARDKYGMTKIAKGKYFFHKNVEGDLIYGVVTVRDVTQRVQLESKLQQFEQLTALGKFTAELAHEIRNPITGISSNAQFLYEEGNLDKKHLEVIKEIAKGADIIEATVKKFLNFGQHPKPNLTEVSVNQLLKESTGLLKKKMDRSGIQLDFSLAKTLPKITLDHDLIQQVFVNIILNSIEAMENGGRLEIETWLAHKRKALDQEKEDYVAVRMSDTGCGVAPEILEKIFDPFFTTKPTGSGLGLFTSYRILKNHDAFIEVQRNQSGGTDILVFFKLTDD